MALQALAAPGLVRAGFRIVLLSGEVETGSAGTLQKGKRLKFRIVLLSGEVETSTCPDGSERLDLGSG